MRKFLMVAALFGAATGSGLAQPPDRPGPQEGPRPGQPPERGPGFGGGNRPSPEDFVNMVMRFDKDSDGKLDRDELMAFAQESPRFGVQGRGGPGGPGRAAAQLLRGRHTAPALAADIRDRRNQAPEPVGGADAP